MNGTLFQKSLITLVLKYQISSFTLKKIGKPNHLKGKLSLLNSGSTMTTKTTRQQ